jgi:RNA polymerase sigma factor (sigma-70 family)
MQAMDDLALLREYAARNSEPAFETLVSRRVNFVYSAALRQVRDPHLAEEVTQAVFILLARKAGQMRDETILTGWLFRTTRFAALAQTRAAAKRRQREREATMQTETQPTAPDAFWEQLSPLLDEALAKLDEKDRQAVLLRYFENKSLSEVGNCLGTSENTAGKRIDRALEKLRQGFLKRGVVSTTAIIAGALAANSVQAAPAALAAAATAVSIGKGAVVGVSTLTLIQGALKIMAWTKLKMAIAIGAGVLLATGATTAIIEHTLAASIKSLTLKVDPEVFIRNVMARADETMNTPTNHYSDILMDVLQMEGFDLGTNHIAFDTKVGEITTRNTPKGLEIFRQIVGDLNRADGKRSFPAPNAPPRRTVLVTCHFYKMGASDFDRLQFDLKHAAVSENGASFWEVKPGELDGLRSRLLSAGLTAFQSPRILTAYGCAASIFVGDAKENVQFKCLPLLLSPSKFGDQALELKLQAGTTGQFTKNPAGDWPAFASRTNCAVFARAGFDDGGGLIFRTKNPGVSSPEDLVLLAETKLDAKPPGK